ncbi:MAG: murein L,D-transpeptidase [Proteobacteria bacterium]|nr:murein L,D-transpeptidase [Pseudomonadota bacterium]
MVRFSFGQGSVVVRAAVVAGAALLLAGCNGNDRFASNSRHYVPMSSQMEALMSEKGMNARSPILFRAFKKESELEVWKQDASGEYKLLKTFPMCRWSGQLGPKKAEGDRQVPEGFYSITPAQLNPNSSYYLSFNIGYPNAYDRQLGRTGAHIMVHGACSSMGCFSMTDEQVADIYALSREAFGGGQKAIQFQSYPFRMNAQNLARYRADENMSFWKNIKEGSDYFEVSKREPKVSVCNARYTFGVETCGGPKDEQLASQVATKARHDEQQVASLVAHTKAVKRIYKDGDQHPVFRQTAYALTSASNPVEVSQVSTPSSVPSLISRPDALDHAGVEVPHEKTKGLSRAQLIAKAEQFKAEEAAAASAPAVAAAPAAAKAAAPAAAVPPKVQPLNAKAVAAAPAPVAPPAQATAFTATEAKKEEGGILSRLTGKLGGLTASSTEVAADAAPQPSALPTPPKR